MNGYRSLNILLAGNQIPSLPLPASCPRTDTALQAADALLLSNWKEIIIPSSYQGECSRVSSQQAHVLLYSCAQIFLYVSSSRGLQKTDKGQNDIIFHRFRLLKPPSKESKRKGDVKEASSLHEQLSRVRHEDLTTPCTPRTPRLERARNLRWHLVELDKFEEIPRLSVSSYSVASDASRQEFSSPPVSERISPLDAENKVDNKVDNKSIVPIPGSSSETTSKGSISSQIQQQHAFEDYDDGDRTSSEYSAGSSDGSPPTTRAEAVGVVWEAPGLCPKAGSTFTPRARRKVSTTKRLQANELDKVITVSFPPPPQEKVKAVRPPSPLPVPSRLIQVASKEDLSTCSPEVVRGVPQTSKSIHNNYSGPLCVRQKRDQSPNLCSQNPSVSLQRSDVARPISHGRKGARNNLSGPLFVQKKRDISPFPSPPRSPLQSPGRSPLCSPKVTGAAFPFQHGLQVDTQIAHPLPLPWPVNTAPISPRSNTSSADRSEDSCKVDTPLVSARWSRSPGPGPAPSGGRWIKGALLGSGSFGKVYRGHHSETGDMCAIKEVEIVSDDPRSQECAKQLAQEIALLSMLRHPNILHYKGSEMVDGESLYIYLELVSGGSIYRLLQEFNTFAEPVIRRYTRQILLGLQFLHNKSTVHRDIKCANILVDQDGRVKLADFGMAKLIGKETAPLSFKGSPYWMAPEVILQNNTGYESAVDIWSLGCTVIEMATGKPPWHQYEGYAAMFKVMNSHEVPIPKSLSPMAHNFVSLCLQRDPARRPSATMLLEHPFVQLDGEASYPSQAVNDNLFQGMLKRNGHKDSMCPSGTRSQAGSRDSAYRFTNGARSPRPSHQAHLPTSRSAIQLSDYAKPRPAGRALRRLGRLTDTEDDANQYEGPRIARVDLSNRNHYGIQGIQQQRSGLDLRPPGLQSPRI
ncbi:hypothetical protein GOP47_0021725 [Adiantum capillus-veneris]|uniref:mitogen-activated protein kinase kinase kinase n=1 Tax=Adiantum capillus-veneris TaxID=13818 RepID=A0A9D4U814_ADICA|nr:hypothetical protein GOP47_0021725 [Adiantum capillus-veneris]